MTLQHGDPAGIGDLKMTQLSFPLKWAIFAFLLSKMADISFRWLKMNHSRVIFGTFWGGLFLRAYLDGYIRLEKLVEVQ